MLPQLQRRFSILILALAWAASEVAGQGVHPVTGRKYAAPMSVAGANWLERAEREREENPSAAIRALELRPGMVVADIGAGTGYFTFRLAEIVGPGGKVYANDIQPGMLALLKDRLRRDAISNVEAILGTEDDPRLPPGQIDVILMVDVYHEFSRPQEMLRKLRDALKPDGRMVLLEFRKEDPSVPIRPEHKMSIKEICAELEPEGFRLEKVHDFLPRQHILMFKRTGATL
jgi:ubiquinone/menaquinone biosynthesis C-methylase UbiE